MSLPAFKTEAEKNQFEDIAKNLRCPTCTGLSVLDSDAAFSEQIKDQVLKQVAAGKPKEEILQFFTERYGPWILRAPPAQGSHLIAWVLPALIALVGVLLILRRRVSSVHAGVRSREEILAELKKRCEER